MIISIEGFRGVGKSTLISELKKIRPDFCYITGEERNSYLKKNLLVVDSDYEKKFYHMQKTLAEYMNSIWKNNFRDNIVIMDRGPEELEFYTKYYPYVNGFKWEVEKELNRELNLLKNMKSDRILFLDGSMDVIIQRRTNDHKVRIENLKSEFLSSELFKEYFLKLEYTKLIYTDKLTIGEVVNCTKDWIENGCEI